MFRNNTEVRPDLRVLYNECHLRRLGQLLLKLIVVDSFRSLARVAPVSKGWLLTGRDGTLIDRDF